MKNYLSISVAMVALVFSGCEKSVNGMQSTASRPTLSPFAVHGPVYSVRIEEGKYRIDTSVVWEGKNKYRLIAELEKENLSEKNSVSEMPRFMRTFFEGLHKDQKMVIADPNQEWNDGNPQVQLFDKTGKPLNNLLPNKQLVYFGLGTDLALFSYYVGGQPRSQEMVIVKFSGEKITDLYFERNGALVTTKSEMVIYMKEHQNSGGC